MRTDQAPMRTQRVEFLNQASAAAEVAGMTESGLQPCGTRAAYLRHLDRGEPACDPCTAANAEHRRAHFDGNRERNKAYKAARYRAEKRLRELYAVTWRRLLREEMWSADEALRAAVEAERQRAG